MRRPMGDNCLSVAVPTERDQLGQECGANAIAAATVGGLRVSRAVRGTHLDRSGSYSRISGPIPFRSRSRMADNSTTAIAEGESDQDDGIYRRPPGSYVRPSCQFDIDANYSSTGMWPVVGTSYHQDALARFRGQDGTEVLVELVPEPGNPHDDTAVACDINGLRVGYKPSGAAWPWHDIVRAANLDGYAVVTHGRILEDDEYEDVGVAIPGQSWSDLVDMTVRFGVRAEFESLLHDLTPDEEEALFLDDANDPDRGVLRGWCEQRGAYPRNSWSPANAPSGETRDYFERMPYWFSYFLKMEAKSRREARMRRRRVEREEARAAARREAERAKQEAAAQREVEARRREAERLDVGRRALRMHSSGSTKAEIGHVLSLSVGQVERAMGVARRQDGVRSTWNEKAQEARRALAREAVHLQETGLTVKQVGERLGRSPESVKSLLSDGKFYADPDLVPERLALARECSVLQNEGRSKDEIVELLDVSRAMALRAFRDAQALDATG